MDLGAIANEAASQSIAARSLPPHWTMKVDPRSGRRYYENAQTKTTSWEHPNDSATSLSPDYWERSTDPSSGRVYYVNHHSKRTEWQVPADSIEKLEDPGTGRSYYVHSGTKNSFWSFENAVRNSQAQPHRQQAPAQQPQAAQQAQQAAWSAQQQEEARARAQQVIQAAEQQRAAERAQQAAQHSQDSLESLLGLDTPPSPTVAVVQRPIKAERQAIDEDKFSRALKLIQSTPECGRCFELLSRYLENAVKHPGERKFQVIEMSNPNFQQVAQTAGGTEAFEAMGFVQDGTSIELMHHSTEGLARGLQLLREFSSVLLQQSFQPAPQLMQPTVVQPGQQPPAPQPMQAQAVQEGSEDHELSYDEWEARQRTAQPAQSPQAQSPQHLGHPVQPMQQRLMQQPTVRPGQQPPPPPLKEQQQSLQERQSEDHEISYEEFERHSQQRTAQPVQSPQHAAQPAQQTAVQPPPPPVQQSSVPESTSTSFDDWELPSVPSTSLPPVSLPAVQPPPELLRSDSDFARRLMESEQAELRASALRQRDEDAAVAARLQQEIDMESTQGSTPGGGSSTAVMLRELVECHGKAPLEEEIIEELAAQLDQGADQEMVLEQVLLLATQDGSSKKIVLPAVIEPPALKRSLSELKHEIEDLNEREECVVCMETRSNTVCIPCGHLSTCKDCAMDPCPVCREPVEKHITVAMDDMEAARELARMYGSTVEDSTLEDEGPETPKGLARELHRRKLEQQCSTCFDGEINCIVMPCGHRCCCEGCGENRKAVSGGCPFCGEGVEEVIRIYQARDAS
eukprot:TRINITY_DN11255_c0_g1_i3.p1 TRINITY_DN11255_c0_g1~~TRINITY_DN11255_c0_g1_i3.p1  ORF type:complete len:797 (-),score=217.58 TRINITY_DN11255_c0_g1_i3:116-2506(-)